MESLDFLILIEDRGVRGPAGLPGHSVAQRIAGITRKIHAFPLAGMPAFWRGKWKIVSPD
jgi:hypothetical protein